MVLMKLLKEVVASLLNISIISSYLFQLSHIAKATRPMEAVESLGRR